MASIKQAFGGIQPISITLASLASAASAGRESVAIDNSANLYLDALVQVKVTLIAGTIGGDQAVYVYVAGSSDGTIWPDAVTGLDAIITINNPTQLRLGTVIYTPTQSLAYISSPFSVASLFGGVMPMKWSIVVRNFSGIALSGTEGNMTKQYNGVYQTVL
jgi:hypothetical protein